MININEVGAFPSLHPVGGFQVMFGVYLPAITAANGYGVIVRIIHRDDRFNPDIPPQDFPLAHQNGTPLDLWTATVPLTAIPNTNFGAAGTYLYRYQLLRTQGGSTRVVTEWFTDPFARETDIGRLPSFSTPGFFPAFAWQDGAFKTPELDDMVVYELQVEEFNDTFDGVVERLDYFLSLGVNVLELMPVTSVKLDFDWGYGPLHYLAPSLRMGGARGLRRLVNECHRAGIAVILDVVYQHVDSSFPYQLVYQDANEASPMIGASGPFGPQADFSKVFTQEYFQAANVHWLQEYHVDGFRYDEVSDYYDGPLGNAYAKLAYGTYQASLAIARFQGPNGYSRIIQCAEALSNGRDVLRGTYTNAVWQDELLNKAEEMAKFHFADDTFAHLLDPGFSGYPATKQVTDTHGTPVDMPVAPFQYLESHDHSQLISFVAATQDDPNDVPFGDRSKFYKLQPFVIALYTCQGIPMLWQGQEFADNYTLPPSGRRRISFLRNVHWEYFYDSPGSGLIRLYRILGRLRRTFRCLRSRESFYYFQQSRPGDQLLAFHRRAPATANETEQIAMVCINFSDTPQQISLPFPKSGVYREMLDLDVRVALGQPPLAVTVANNGDFVNLQVSSNYGTVFILA